MANKELARRLHAMAFTFEDLGGETEQNGVGVLAWLARGTDSGAVCVCVCVPTLPKLPLI